MQTERVRPELTYTCGFDIGQAQDFSALAIVERTVTGTGEFAVDSASKVRREASRTLYAVRHLERLPLGLGYLDQISHVAAVLARPPLNGAANLIVDMSGCGRPVFELVQNAGLPKAIGVTITGGGGETRVSSDEFRVSKQHLVTTLQARLHDGTLRIAADLPEAKTLLAELQDFRVLFTAAGAATFSARSGRHDDTILAVALAVWHAAKPVEWAGMIKLGGW